MKNIVLILLSLLVLPLTAKTEEISLGQIYGTAKTIGDAIVGETTITPAYALFKDDYRWAVDTETFTEHISDSIRRSMVTGTYFYSRSYVFRATWGASSHSSTAPFPLNGVGRLNFSTYEEYDPVLNLGPSSSKILENFSLAVWIASIKHTGLWPPNRGPYETYVKMGAQQQVLIAPGIIAGTTKFSSFRGGFSPRDTGFVTGTVGWVGYQYTWPGLCWTGEFYEY